MKIKILVSCSGGYFSFKQGDTVDATAEIAKDLIAAGYAEEVKTGKPKECVKNADT